jgi:hypothetical protein
VQGRISLQWNGNFALIGQLDDQPALRKAKAGGERFKVVVFASAHAMLSKSRRKTDYNR